MKPLFIFGLIFLLFGGVAMPQFDFARAEAADGEFSSLVRQIKELGARQNYAAATPLAEEALALAEQKFGPTAIETAKALNILGTLHIAQKHADEARKAYARYIDIAEPLVSQKVLAADDPDVDRATGMLMKVYQEQGRFDELERILRRAIDMAEQGLPRDHAYTLGLINGLANLYDTQNRSAEAEQLFRRSTEIATKILTAENPQLGPSMTRTEVEMIAGDIAGHYKARGHPDEAERLFKQLVEALEKQYRVDDPKLIAALHNLGETYEFLGRDEDAKRHYERAISIGEKALAVTPSDEMISLNLSLARQKLQLWKSKN